MALLLPGIQIQHAGQDLNPVRAVYEVMKGVGIVEQLSIDCTQSNGMLELSSANVTCAAADVQGVGLQERTGVIVDTL